MELALISARQIVAILVLMLAGVICQKTGILDREVNKRLSDLLLLIVSPVLIFLSFQREYEPELARNLLISFALSLLAFAIAIAAATAVFRKKAGDGGLSRMDRFGAIYGNAGFLGIPLVNGVFGSEGVFYLTAFITAFNLIVWTHGVICMSGSFSGKALRKGLFSPSIIAIFLGAACFFARIRLPELVTAPLEHISALNTGLAMLIAGVSVANTDLGALAKNARALLVCLMRLVVCPVLFALVLKLLPLDLPLVLRGTVVLASATPVATMIILFAYRYGGDDLYGTQVFTASTLLCAATIPFVMLLV